MNILKKLKSATLIAGVLGVFAMGLTSCLKDNNQYIAANPNALLMVIQASPDAPAESLFLKPNQVNQSSFNYGDYLGYFNAYTGNRLVQLFNYGTTALIASDSIHLVVNTAYSLFLANTYSKPDFILLTDSLKQPVAGGATIRFVNVSTDAGNVDLLMDTTKLITNQPYKGASLFKPVSANNSKHTFEVRVSGSTTVLASLENADIRSGGVYTIWFHGTATGASPNLSVGIIANAYY